MTCSLTVMGCLQGDDDAFYVLNADQLLRQDGEWRRLLPRVEPHYALKCNNDPVLLRMLAALGCAFDCASKNEIEAVLALRSVPPDRIIYANPLAIRFPTAASFRISLLLQMQDSQLHPSCRRLRSSSADL